MKIQELVPRLNQLCVSRKEKLHLQPIDKKQLNIISTQKNSFQSESDHIKPAAFNPPIVRKTVYRFTLKNLNDNANLGKQYENIISYKCVEHAFRLMPPVLPTMARGLFVRELTAGSSTIESKSSSYQIVARGYDKFFNGMSLYYKLQS